MKCLFVIGLLGLVGCGIDNEMHDPNEKVYPAHTPDALVNPEQEDVFMEPSPQPVDVLFVIDKSCSMADDTLAMNEGLSDFLDYVGEHNLDYHIGVISTTNEQDRDAGILVPFWEYTFITPQTKSALAVLSGMNIVSAYRGEVEAGIDAVSAAMGPRLRQGENQGFFRYGVPLQIVTITDEEDQSYYWTPRSLVNRLYEYMVEYDTTVYYSAILTMPSSLNSCGFDVVNETVGYRYMEVVERVNGLAIDICENDWSTALEALAEYATPEPVNEFVLTEYPVEDSIQVLVERNNVTLSFEMEGDWNYDPVRNSIWINSSNQTIYNHQEGDLVKIKYEIDMY